MNEIDDLSARLGEACGRSHLLVATAESCTAGGVGEAVTRTAGSSGWFDRGFIAYSGGQGGPPGRAPGDPGLPRRRVRGVLLISTVWLRLAALGYSNFQGDEVLALCRPGVTQPIQDFLMGQRKGPIQYLITCSYGVYDPNFSSEFLIRLPFAFANILSVGFFYLLVRQYFNTVIALYAALLMATNGLFVAFARIVQYQSITILATISALYFLSLANFHFRWKLIGLYLGLIAASISVLSHFDGFSVIPPAAYLVYHWYRDRRTEPANRSYRWHMVASIVFAVSIAASFYVPYLMNVSDYQIKYWSERISGVTSNSLMLFEIYNPTFVVYVYIALAVLSLFRVRRWRR